jgi:hypothetical protein
MLVCTPTDFERRFELTAAELAGAERPDLNPEAVAALRTPSRRSPSSPCAASWLPSSERMVYAL